MDEIKNLFSAPFDGCINEFEQLLHDRNKVFLLGAGCSKCAGLPLTSELVDKVQEKLSDDGISIKVFNQIIDGFNKCEGVLSIKDYLSELIDHISIAQRKVDKGKKEVTIKISEGEYSIQDLKNVLAEIKAKIFECIDGSEIDISTHRKFIKAVHSAMKASKTNSRLRTDYIVLNYDTLIEDALSLEGVKYVDGFKGGAIGSWDIAEYNSDNILTNVLKPHGSLDWSLLEHSPLPIRMRDEKIKKGIVKTEKYLIWPASTKYRETQIDPYAQILDLVRKTLRPESNNQSILITCGYRFSDTHINIEIENALKESNKNLTVIAFFGEDKPSEILQKWINDDQINQQIRIHCNKGFYHSNNVLTSEENLVWWKFEALTRILEGERA